MKIVGESWKIYVPLIIGVIFSIVLALEVTSWDLRALAAIPGVTSLLGGLFTLSRDESAFQKQVHLQSQQQFFTLGAASHMANVVFDKHIEFCEAYMAEVHRTMQTLQSDGPSENALKHSGNFFRIRNQYFNWIPESLVDQLRPFENAIGEIGILSRADQITPGANAKSKWALLDRINLRFERVLGFTDHEVAAKGDTSNDDIKIERVKENIRRVLGVEELTRFREQLIKKASSSLEEI